MTILKIAEGLEPQIPTAHRAVWERPPVAHRMTQTSSLNFWDGHFISPTLDAGQEVMGNEMKWSSLQLCLVEKGDSRVCVCVPMCLYAHKSTRQDLILGLGVSQLEQGHTHLRPQVRELEGTNWGLLRQITDFFRYSKKMLGNSPYVMVWGHRCDDQHIHRGALSCTGTTMRQGGAW